MQEDESVDVLQLVGGVCPQFDGLLSRLGDVPSLANDGVVVEIEVHSHGCFAFGQEGIVGIPYKCILDMETRVGLDFESKQVIDGCIAQPIDVGQLPNVD